ncbi:MAG: CNNM domain-containing protein [Puniceicoccales bacterium]|jgi:CBS domain containing-hemolysin-like protein|nr:CNNM domain-containing protein [Puniceicoccales bacterium]
MAPFIPEDNRKSMGTIFFACGVMLAVSFLASLLEGILVSTTVSELEIFKQKHPHLGKIFAYYWEHSERALAAFLGIDTATTSTISIFLGAMLIKACGEASVLPGSIIITSIEFVFTDILAKMLGIYHRRRLLRWAVYPMRVIVWIMFPISWACSLIVRLFIPRTHGNEDFSDEALILTAKRGVADGVLTSVEGTMLEQTLTLDDVAVETIAQKPIFSLDAAKTVAEIFHQYPEIPYGRIPVYEKEPFNFIGIVRRRDLLQALAADKHQAIVSEFVREMITISWDTKISGALEILLQRFQQISLIRGKDGKPIGVLTIEDIFEYILDRDIFEYDDLSNFSRSDFRKGFAKKISTT